LGGLNKTSGFLKNSFNVKLSLLSNHHQKNKHFL
jgi:hypothetical protein